MLFEPWRSNRETKGPLREFRGKGGGPFFLFVFAWNEMMYAIVLSRSEAMPIMILFVNLRHSPTGERFGEAAGPIVLGVIPAYVLTLAFQR